MIYVDLVKGQGFLSGNIGRTGSDLFDMIEATAGENSFDCIKDQEGETQTNYFWQNIATHGRKGC